MKKSKVIISLILVCATVFSCMTFVSGAKSISDFKDLDRNAEYFPAVEWAVNKGYMVGTSANTFSPDMVFTRAQLATLLSSFSGDDLTPYKGQSVFSDVSSGAWYAATSVWAYRNGIMSGTGGNNFSPNNQITRQEAAVMLQKYASYKGLYLEYENKQVRLMDRGSKRTATWAKDAVKYAYRVGFMTLDENDCFNPTNLVTRADAAMIMYAYSNAIDKTTAKNEPIVVAYCNASSPVMTDEFKNVDVLNIHPAKASGESKTINENFIKKVNIIIPEALEQNPDMKFVLTICVDSGRDIEKWLYPYYNCDDFAQKIVNVIQKYNFDGVDFDYEFPTGDVPQSNLQYFLTSLRTKLEKLGETTGKDYLITMAVPGGTWLFSNYSDIGELQHYVDFFNLMNYDMHSERNKTYNHCALYFNPEVAGGDPNQLEMYAGGSTDDEIMGCLQRGVQRSKLIVGVGAYSQDWNNVQGNGTNGMFCPGVFNDAQPMGLNELYSYINYDDPSTPVGGFYTHWDDVTKAVSLYNPDTGYLRSFDDLRSTECKCDYVVEKNLGGIMVFDYNNVTGLSDSNGRLWFFDLVHEWLGLD